MRIAFTGTHGTGKTSLLQAIKKELAPEISFGFVTEVARKIIKSGYSLNKDATVRSYIHYINEQLKAEKGIENYDIFISDRTLLDPLAYAIVNKESEEKNDFTKIDLYFIEMMQNVWLLEKEKYDFYVHFPIEFTMEADGVRPEDEMYRKKIDKKILFLLKENDVEFVSITGSVEKRKKDLMDLINER